VPALEIVGPIYGPTGYDRHTREFTRHLSRLGVALQLTPLRGWSPELPELMQDSLFPHLMQQRPTDLTLHFAMPNHCLPRRGRPNVNYTMFEGDRIPSDWATRAAGHDRIVVPTAICAEAWIDSGVDPAKVRVSPLAVDGAFFSQPAEPLSLATTNAAGAQRSISSYAVRLLNIAELRPRKNLLGLLRTWIRATTAGDDAVLILKSLSFSPQDQTLFLQDVQEMQQRLGKGLQQAAPVLLLSGTMTDSQLRSLYAAATHYLSMSLGEGWDLPMMEAAAAGLQLIAPNHSAYRTYLTEQEAELIPVNLEAATIEGRSGAADSVFFSDSGVRWWRPDEDAATAILRRIVQGSPPKPSPQARIVRDYTWSGAALQLLEILRELTPEL